MKTPNKPNQQGKRQEPRKVVRKPVDVMTYFRNGKRVSGYKRRKSGTGSDISRENKERPGGRV